MTATMSRPTFKRQMTGGFGCGSHRMIPGSIKLEELLHPEETARRAEESRRRREAVEAARREETQRHAEHDAAVEALRHSLPPVGSVIRILDDSLAAAVHHADFDGKHRLYVCSRIVGEYPGEPHRVLVSSKSSEVPALRCFLTYAGFKQVIERTRGYLEFAGITAVKVVSHSTSGKAVNVEITDL